MADAKVRRQGVRRWLVPVAIILVALIILVSLSVNITTEALWYHSVAASQVYWTRLVTGVALFFAFGLVSAGIVVASLLAAMRGGPRHQVVMGVRVPGWLVVALPAVVVGVGIGWIARVAVDTALGWWNQVPFGTTDATFGKDVAFYVYSLPWWQMVASLSMTVLVLTGVLTGLFYLVTAQGSPVSVRATQHDGVVTPEVKVSNPFSAKARSHLSIIIGLAVAVYGWRCLLDRYSYVYMDNGLFTGVGYTEAHARLIARLVVAIIAFICAAVFMVNVRMQRWMLSITSLILMVVSSIVVSGVYPAIVQRVSVTPDEPVVQAPYIANNIASTRAAYGIDGVQITNYSAQTTTSAGQLKSDAEVLPGIRLIDPSVVAPTFEQKQQVRQYYQFPSTLDVDRYDLTDPTTGATQTTDTIVAAREINQSTLPDQSWNNIHTVYTHGYGMVAAYGNQRESDGTPVWLEQNIPPTGALDEQQSRIYFGEQTTTYAIVGQPPGAAPVELDTPGGGTDNTPGTMNTYDGTGGVAIGNVFMRALFALKYGDINMLLSDRVNAYSKILYDRTPQERVQKVAPWLTIDGDTYPAIVDGRLVWILDCYTTTDNYPDSEDSSLGSGANAIPVNYVRNSVKATVDALDGTVTLYAWDDTDPILQTWMKTYPGIVQPKSAISADLMAHLRYPTDLFNTQRSILGLYHVTDPTTWYQKSDLWQVPPDPRSTGSGQEPPYYLSIQWPGDTAPVFSLSGVYVPNGRQNLGGYLSVVADARSPEYGQLRVLQLSSTQQISGPGQIFAAIITDTTVTQKLLPYTQQDSTAVYGNLLTLPLGGGLIYVMPIYTVASSSSSASYPLLRFVVVSFGNQIAIGDTLQEALDSVFQGDAGATTGETPTTGETTVPSSPPPTSTPTPTPTPTPTGTLTGQAAAQQDLADAQAAFAAAQQALTSGDLATYQAQMAIAQQKVAEAVQALS